MKWITGELWCWKKFLFECIKFGLFLEIHQGPLHHHPGRLLQSDQLPEGHHVHPGAGLTPPQGGGSRDPAGGRNPRHGDQSTGGGLWVHHQGNHVTLFKFFLNSWEIFDSQFLIFNCISCSFFDHQKEFWYQS